VSCRGLRRASRHHDRCDGGRNRCMPDVHVIRDGRVCIPVAGRPNPAGANR
jgi:hypothetical protein